MSEKCPKAKLKFINGVVCVDKDAIIKATKEYWKAAMPKPPKPPREWWIYMTDTERINFLKASVTPMSFNDGSPVHRAIEYEAYLALRAELAECNEQRIDATCRLRTAEQLLRESADVSKELAERRQSYRILEEQKERFISGLKAANAQVAELVGVLRFYAGNFDGKEGSHWIEDRFFVEDKFGATSSDKGDVAREALTKLEGK